MFGLNPSQWGGLARAAVLFAGGVATVFGYMTGANWEALAGTIASVAGALSSLHSNKTTSLVKAVADSPEVSKVVMTTSSAADDIPASNVVGPSGH